MENPGEHPPAPSAGEQPVAETVQDAVPIPVRHESPAWDRLTETPGNNYEAPPLSAEEAMQAELAKENGDFANSPRRKESIAGPIGRIMEATGLEDERAESIGVRVLGRELDPDRERSILDQAQELYDRDPDRFGHMSPLEWTRTPHDYSENKWQVDHYEMGVADVANATHSLRSIAEEPMGGADARAEIKSMHIKISRDFLIDSAEANEALDAGLAAIDNNLQITGAEALRQKADLYDRIVGQEAQRQLQEAEAKLNEEFPDRRAPQSAAPPEQPPEA